MIQQALDGLAARVDWASLFDWDAVLADLVRVVFIVLLALAGYRFIAALTRRLERDVEEPDPLVKRMREQRAKTMASLVRSVSLVVIVVLAALTMLGLFIEIGPLLATAGVAGLAISFGAQSLVKDVITGSFILLEGQFGIGDVIRVGETSGMVERMTLRTTVLRDLHGTVHIIPNGTIGTVSNLTKNWSRAVLDVSVAYREDPDRVMDVLRDIGAEIHADPEWRDLFLEEPQIPGVDALADSGVVIRMVAKTLPLKQWDVARELRRRIKKRFDREGIEIPFPHVTFYWGADQIPPALAAGRADAGLGVGGGGRGD